MKNKKTKLKAIQRKLLSRIYLNSTSKMHEQL